jgi:hypothetical protein
MLWKLIVLYTFHISSGSAYQDYRFYSLYPTKTACEDAATEFLGAPIQPTRCLPLTSPKRRALAPVSGSPTNQKEGG